MKKFILNDTNVFVSTSSHITERVIINIITNTINIEYSIPKYLFLNYISELDLIEVKDGCILWDEYIEDDGETTRFNQHEISIYDYINNYMLNSDLMYILQYLANHNQQVIFNIQNQ